MKEPNLVIIDLLQQILTELKELNKQPVQHTYNFSTSIAEDINEKMIKHLLDNKIM